MLYLDSLKKYNCKIQYNHSSISHFQSGGNIKYLITPFDVAYIGKILNELNANNIKYVLSGNATNILIKDEGYKGAFISFKGLNNILSLDDGYYVQPGVSLHKLSLIAKADGLSGLEEISDIPASIGGAIAMNASAYKKCISDVIEYVDVFIDKDIERLYFEDLDFKYRDSIIRQKKYPILGCKIKLNKENTLYINAKMKKFSDLRCATQPRGISLGSVFKKVNNVSAGFYIERAGLKGEKIGGAMISNKHANFIINVNRAKSKDFIDLAKIAKTRVNKAFNIDLKYEILIV